MIIKKLEPVHGSTFPRAAYNEQKVKGCVAELAGHANIDGKMPPTAGKSAKVGNEPERAITKKDLVEKKKRSKIHSDIKKLKNADGKALSKTEQYQLNWLVETLRSKFGIAIHFQKDKNGVVRGYGIVDHNNEVALNGSDVMKLADIVNFKEWQAVQKVKAEKAEVTYEGQRDDASPIVYSINHLNDSLIVRNGSNFFIATTCVGHDSPRVQIGQNVNARIVVSDKTLWQQIFRK